MSHRKNHDFSVDCCGIFVVSITFIVCLMLPRLVAINFVRCNFTFLTVRFSHVLNNPCLISAIQVNLVELKHSEWYQLMSSIFSLQVCGHTLV